MNRRMKKAAQKIRRVLRCPAEPVAFVIPEKDVARPTGHSGNGPHTGINPKGGKR